MASKVNCKSVPGRRAVYNCLEFADQSNWTMPRIAEKLELTLCTVLVFIGGVT